MFGHQNLAWESLNLLHIFGHFRRLRVLDSRNDESRTDDTFDRRNSVADRCAGRKTDDRKTDTDLRAVSDDLLLIAPSIGGCDGTLARWNRIL